MTESIPYSADFKHHRIERIRAGMGGNVLVVFEPGKFSTIAHGKNLWHKAVKGTDTNPPLDCLAIEHNHIIHLMAKMAGSCPAEHSNFNTITAIIMATACFRAHFSSSNKW